MNSQRKRGFATVYSSFATTGR